MPGVVQALEELRVALGVGMILTALAALGTYGAFTDLESATVDDAAEFFREQP